MKIEVYIEDQLCDLDKPDISMRFKRQFIKPTELNTKDAQKSYSITIPATPRNNKILNYGNIEETDNKFGKIYSGTKVYIDSVNVFDGSFLLSEITQRYYKGNLVVVAPKSIKDVFGEIAMSQAGRWIIPFKGVADITTYNNKENAECIFPLVLYGLLPKQGTNNIFTPKNVYDDTVRLTLDDFPPSVNVIQMLQRIFKNANYSLTGSAINDRKLNSLYVSYKNPNDFEYGAFWPMGKMQIQGSWQAIKNGEVESKINILTDGRKRNVVNFFDSSNAAYTISDSGSNITNKDGRTTFIVPATGLYKISFENNFSMPQDESSIDEPIIVEKGNLNDVHTEIKIIKNLGLESGRNISEITFDNIFFRNNLNQNAGDSNTIFPKLGEVNFIDPLVNKDLISGFAFGKYDDVNFINPLNGDHCNPMAIKGGYSWSAEYSDGTRDRAYSATQSSGYAYADGSDEGHFKVDLNRTTIASKAFDYSANGELNQIIWLEKGDRLDIIGVSFAGSFPLPVKDTIFNYAVDYTLTLEPFQHNIGWLKMDNDGASTAPMNWNDASTFTKDEINLIKFLPSEVKVNDWIDNFCKAFNLRLENTGTNRFELNIKSTDIMSRLSNIIDLDKKANVYQRSNQSLGLPYMYDLGFTIDNNEEGYVRSMSVSEETGERVLNTGTTGGGQFRTGSFETNVIQQTSNFSYCWYKQLFDTNENDLIKVPVITDSEIWENDYDYGEMMGKTFFDKSQRFWYKTGVKELILNNNAVADIAIVGNEYSGASRLILDYENKSDSILRNYFLLLTNSKSYTIIDCYLSPEEYTMLSKSLIKFNGDLYHAAEIDGYDPLGKNTGTLKLIRRIV